MLILIILLALIFDFVNGFHDTANAIATSVMTSALRIPYAIMMAATLNFAGAMLGTSVAETIGKSIVDPSTITQTVIISTLISAITWNIITWKYGLPSSSSHALIGSLIGVVLVQGLTLKLEGVKVIVLALIISPLMGLFGGIVIMILFYRLFRNIRVSKINRVFRKVQVVSAAFMALSHGGNDAQKSMGIITMALIANNLITGHFYVPTWVKISCALAMAFGTAVGGWKIIKTVGRGIIEIKPIQGCAADTTSATVIQLATHIGLPVSTTHVVTSSICGVGAAENVYNVNWNVMKNIVLAWFFTIPFVAIFAAVIYKVIHFLQTVMH
ncbi:MAG: anion permease [Candidatus Xenobiia bacterium LiM19]